MVPVTISLLKNWLYFIFIFYKSNTTVRAYCFSGENSMTITANTKLLISLLTKIRPRATSENVWNYNIDNILIL